MSTPSGIDPLRVGSISHEVIEMSMGGVHHELLRLQRGDDGRLELVPMTGGMFIRGIALRLGDTIPIEVE